jgi:hypothetical protein
MPLTACENALTYDVFVSELLQLLSPLFPGEHSVALEFSADQHNIADSATLYGTQAKAFMKVVDVAQESLDIADGSYLLGKTLVREESMLRHSAYARNINRWRNADMPTLPRKKKCRMDLVIMATCWLYAWGDARLATSDTYRAVRRTVWEWAGGDVEDAMPKTMVARLWQMSVAAYAVSSELYK